MGWMRELLNNCGSRACLLGGRLYEFPLMMGLLHLHSWDISSVREALCCF